MDMLRVGIIGTGRRRGTEGATGFGMAHAHAQGYEAHPACAIVALADINRENAEAFRAAHGGTATIYTDYRKMLVRENLDIVSVCTWPALHSEMVIAVAEAGVRAVHCEKPMAPTFGEARRMIAVCEANRTQLTFNHQRRFSTMFRRAKELLKAGAIGDLIRMEASCSNLYDWGTHWFDMLNFYNDETPVEWVLGQIEPHGGRTYFGVTVEAQGISHFQYTNGVRGLLVTGPDTGWEAENRLIGSAGVIEVAHRDGTPLRVWGRGQSDWHIVDVSGGVPNGLPAVPEGVKDLVDALLAGREPELSGRRALRATELIFATYESSRRRGRVTLPLEIEDSPLAAMLAEG